MSEPKLGGGGVLHPGASASDQLSAWRIRALAACRLVRPINAAMMTIGIAAGGVLAAGGRILWLPGMETLWWAMIAGTAIGAAANAINDVFDVEIDRLNRPSRPLVSGEVSVRAAWILWGVLSLLGVALAAWISVWHAAIAVISVGVLFVYSRSLKRLPLWGNLAVAVVIGAAILFGGLVPLIAGYGTLPSVFVGAGFAAVLTLARELVKDVEDETGDTALGARTLPVVVGRRAVGWLAVALILGAILVLPAGAVIENLGPAFVALALPAAGFLLAAAWFTLDVGDVDPEAARAAAARASAMLKVAMLAGLVALAVAAW